MGWHLAGAGAPDERVGQEGVVPRQLNTLRTRRGWAVNGKNNGGNALQAWASCKIRYFNTNTNSASRCWLGGRTHHYLRLASGRTAVDTAGGDVLRGAVGLR